MSEPSKRAAYEPAADLAKPLPVAPAMKRPASIVAGAVIVLLRVLSGAAVLGAVMLDGTPWASWLSVLSGGERVSADDLSAGVQIYVVVTAVVLLVQLTLSVLILRGQNLARVLVMCVSVVSISAAFVGWWSEGQEITLAGTLISLALDILILLALSSRSAATYARRNEHRAP
ncbi:hypothetical protein [Microbacterium sp. P01]|uniref:hypothetical protein n=1 Tax=unclassified Microbacterium TaxID=2609290 RepID=UPI00366C8FB5